MTVAVNDIPRRLRFDLPAALLCGLAGSIAIALVFRGGAVPALVSMTAGWLAYTTAVFRTWPDSRARTIANYLAVCGLYGASTTLIDSLQVPTHHAALLAFDRHWLGETPSVTLAGRFDGWPNDLLSAAYLNYHLYLHWALLDLLWRPEMWRRSSYSRVVFPAFAIGFTGYSLFPSCGPEVAFPDLYGSPLQGGGLTRLNEWIVGHLASRYDAFPSLHVLVTVSLLACDWRWFRTRFWIMLLPAAGMIVATIPLRLHYAADLLASTVLIVPILWLAARGGPNDVE